MEMEITQGLPQGAREIRQAVFVEEQGFTMEFDDIDALAWHAVLSENGVPLATGRTFPAGEPGFYTIGRVAVRKERRRQGLGEKILLALEEKTRSLGARGTCLCAQVRAQGFYEALGYQAYGEIVYDEEVPKEIKKKETQR